MVCLGATSLSLNLPGWCWARIKQLALIGWSSSLHSEACKALGGSDGVVHSTISLAAICMRAVANWSLGPNPWHQVKWTQRPTGFMNLPHPIACLLQTTHYTSNDAFPVIFFHYRWFTDSSPVYFFRFPPTRNVLFFMHVPVQNPLHKKINVHFEIQRSRLGGKGPFIPYKG